MQPNTPITINDEEITRLSARLKNAALGGESVMNGGRFLDEGGAAYPVGDLSSTIDFSILPSAVLTDVENLAPLAGGDGFTVGAALAQDITTAAPAVQSRLMRLYGRLNQYGLDLDQFLAENDNIEDINQLSATQLQNQVTFYEITEDQAG